MELVDAVASVFDDDTEQIRVVRAHRILLSLSNWAAGYGNDMVLVEALRRAGLIVWTPEDLGLTRPEPPAVIPTLLEYAAKDQAHLSGLGAWFWDTADDKQKSRHNAHAVAGIGKVMVWANGHGHADLSVALRKAIGI